MLMFLLMNLRKNWGYKKMEIIEDERTKKVFSEMKPEKLEAFKKLKSANIKMIKELAETYQNILDDKSLPINVNKERQMMHFIRQAKMLES